MSSDVPLSVLDLVPISSGSTAAEALRNTLDLARRAEEFGYHRYWLAEHHLNPGVAGTSPALIISLVAGATARIRVGSGAVQLGHHTPLSVVEQFGLLDAVHPGRIDLGLGRSGGAPRTPAAPAEGAAGVAEGAGESEEPGKEEALGKEDGPGKEDGLGRTEGTFTDSGLYLPPKYTGFARLLASPRFRLHQALLRQPGATTPEYPDQIDDILALLAGKYRSAGGVEAHVVPGEGAAVEVWILGSSGGTSALTAAARGLPFAANYHVSPGTVVEAVEAYRKAFRPSPALAGPRVLVSADVVVAPDDATARRLASGYGLWVRSIRTAEGAIPFPTPEEAARHRWSDEDRALVADRVDTQFVGSPETVVERLEALRAATGADELLITTITHGHEDRVRSYELLADAWAKRS
ncbi:LLM class flavin-dependent oxidoreductase [Streptomyces hygroscopicus]|uniref:LLM class flavin-dependent oxidoreductase n=1 Tax=Streptomyces hygroscopicus TaxID=1912 RepID=UPI0007679AE2|nr:LLM class flavin-dependent oxidoreductase [Streptomyces hygroscopicus]